MADQSKQKPLVLKPGDGRHYPMGRLSATFKADLNETDNALSVSEWWLEPNTEGPPIHKHPEAHVFYMLKGKLAFYLRGKDWLDAERGSYIYIPGEIEHGFENRSDKVAGFMSINTPGGFEVQAPHIVQYFEANPLGDVNKKV